MQRVLTLFCLFLLTGPVGATAGSLAVLEIQERASGRTLPLYASDGHWFIAGRPGAEYRLNLRSRADGDLLAVVSVDGINVVTGETASAAQGGYVLEPGMPLTIAGWRKSLAKVAAFYFTDHGDSYAYRTGRPDNVGVIGVALFRRKSQPLAELAPQRQRAEAGASDDAGLRPVPGHVEKKIGTGHGRSENAPARYVQFERASEAPDEVIAIHYDTYDNLVARGVIRPERKLPLPFPGGFVPDPPQRG